ncbi:MAG: flagellar biosynthesis anti-sigma factor FlgM [Hydrogenophilus sp.]|nr:flagellar biosynthesis anti-sigma factor FlgM [Hydrogenophilus sp.]
MVKIQPTSTQTSAVGTASSLSPTRPPPTPERNENREEGSQAAVAISPLAAVLARVEQAMEQIPEIQWEKVNELRAAIRNGEFRIHPERIAERLLAEAHALLQSGQSGEAENK